ncbi:hypothetical protein BBJ28_00004649 [Nothophytophthora sp. Chile5]|nr:hypothetical protein BBJ28_00004649 [Nothophytophthora sp. Chile5]
MSDEVALRVNGAVPSLSASMVAERVDSLALAAVSEQLGVSESEFLAGVAVNTDCVPLLQLLPETSSPTPPGLETRRPSGSLSVAFCRRACVLICASPIQQHVQVSPLPALSHQSDGQSILERLLREMTRPALLEHIVISHPRLVSAAERVEITRVAHKVCTSRRIRVDLVAADDEGSAVFGCCRLLRRSSTGRPSVGFLLVSCDRVFNAASFRMMMVLGTEPDENHGKRSVRALVDLAEAADSSVFQHSSERKKAATRYAGLVACSDACIPELERLFAVESEDSQGRTLAGAFALIGSASTLEVQQVIASDFCVGTPCSASHEREGRGYGDDSSQRHGVSDFSSFRVGCKTADPSLEAGDSSGCGGGEETPLLGAADADSRAATKLTQSHLETLLAHHPDQSYLIQSAFQPKRSGKDWILAFPNRNQPVEAASSRVKLPSLPSAVMAIKLEALVRSEAPTAAAKLFVTIRKRVPVIGYAALALALGAASLQAYGVPERGAVVDVAVLFGLFWRLAGAAMVLFPFAALSVFRHGLPTLNRRALALFLLCALSFAVWTASTLLLAPFLFPASPRASLLASCQPLLLVGLRVGWTRQLRSGLELLGVLVAFSGAVLCLTSPAAGAPAFRADLVALAGAMAGVCFLLTAQRLRAKTDVCLLAFALLTAASIALLLLLLTLGAFRLEPLPAGATSVLAAWSLATGSTALVAALKYFEPLAVASVLLVQPVAAGVASAPARPVAAVLGVLSVLLGVLLILRASHDTEREIDASQALAATASSLPAAPSSSSPALLAPHPPHTTGRRRHSLSSSCWSVGRPSSSRSGDVWGPVLPTHYGSCSST